MNIANVKYDCKHFKGTIPCTPNKIKNSVCDNCKEYKAYSIRILIIKLGAIGDVIRTTPLIVKYKKIYPDCHISWLTQYPDVLPADSINEILSFDFKSVYILLHQKFDITINLDKEFEACSLLYDIDSKVKYGYTLEDGHIALANPSSEHKFLTGLYDNISIKNTKHYLEEIFEIC